MTGVPSSASGPGLGPDPLLALFQRGRSLRLRAGTVVFAEGDASNRVIWLLGGRVKVSLVTDEGLETVLGFDGAGEILGELSALDGEPHAATVTVVEDGEALVLPASVFLDAVHGEPDVAHALLLHVTARLREANRRRAEFVTLDVTGRVAQRLVDLAETTGVPDEEGILVGIALSQRELAGWVGASREAVNKSLALLADLGLVTASRRRLVVRDLDGLRRRAG